jgi:hypothetical protein
MDIVVPVLAYLGCVAGILMTYAMALYLVFTPPGPQSSPLHKVTSPTSVHTAAAAPLATATPHKVLATAHRRNVIVPSRRDGDVRTAQNMLPDGFAPRESFRAQ